MSQRSSNYDSGILTKILFSLFIFVLFFLALAVYSPTKVLANFIDLFSDNSKITAASINNPLLNISSGNISLNSSTNNLNDSSNTLLHSGLGSDSEINSPLVGHPGSVDVNSFVDTNHFATDSATVGYYPFTSDATDYSGHNNTGVAASMVHTGQHYDFAGNTNSKITVNSSASLNGFTQFTLMAWVKTNYTPGSSQAVIEKGSENYSMIISAAGVPYCSFRDNPGAAFHSHYDTTNYSYNWNNNWHQIACTYDGTNLCAYIDGVSFGCDNVGSYTTYIGSSTVLLGGAPNTYGPFNGSMDEVLISNRGLNASEILAQYNTTHSTPTSTVSYVSGQTGNAASMSATTRLSFSNQDFNSQRGTISFSAALPDWSINSNQYFFYAKDNSSGNYVKISKPAWANGALAFYFSNSTSTNYVLTTSSDTSHFTNNSWHNFVFTWDITSSYIRAFVDGSSGGSNIYSYVGWKDNTDWGSNFNSFVPASLCLGNDCSGNNPLNGSMDELKVLNRPYELGTYSYRPQIIESTTIDTHVTNPVFGKISWTGISPSKTNIILQTSSSDDGTIWTPYSNLSKGLVTLTFDDGLTSVYTKAFPAMNVYGYKGVSYPILNSFGNTNYATANNLLTMQSAGWEIGAHTMNHVRLATMTAAQQRTEISGDYTGMTNLGFNQTDFNYPYGDYNNDTLSIISDYYANGRTVENGFNTFPSKYTLLNEDGSQNVSTVEQYVDKAVSDKSWLILMFHDIDNGGISNVPLASFSAILAYISTSSANVVGINDGLNQISAYTNNTGQTITSPSKRYLKYRAILESQDGVNTPTLQSVTINEPATIYLDVSNTINTDGTVTHSAWPTTSDTPVNNLSVTPTGGSINITVNTWDISGDYYKKWTETASAYSTTTDHTVGDLIPGNYYDVLTNGVLLGTYQANGAGQITFSYTGGSSTVTFEVKQGQTSETNNSSNNSSNISNSSCNNQAPTLSPDLFQINTSGTKATLYFAPAGMPYDNYVIRFGPTANNLLYSASFSRGFASGVIYYTINELNPNTIYYFQVRAGNGCKPGEWGNTVSAKTTGSSKSTVTYYKSFGGFIQSLVNTFSPKYTGNAIKNSTTNTVNNQNKTTAQQKVVPSPSNQSTVSVKKPTTTNSSIFSSIASFLRKIFK